MHEMLLILNSRERWEAMNNQERWRKILLLIMYAVLNHLRRKRTKNSLRIRQNRNMDLIVDEM